MCLHFGPLLQTLQVLSRRVNFGRIITILCLKFRPCLLCPQASLLQEQERNVSAIRTTNSSSLDESLNNKVIKGLMASALHPYKQCNIAILASPFSDIWKESLPCCIVPNKLRIANVFPVYKNNDLANFSNYRPISPGRGVDRPNFGAYSFVLASISLGDFHLFNYWRFWECPCFCNKCQCFVMNSCCVLTVGFVLRTARSFFLFFFNNL